MSEEQYDPNTKTPWKLRKNGPPVSNDTVVATTLGCALAIITVIASSAWALRGQVEEFKNEIEGLKRGQTQANEVSWNVYDQQSWAGDLRARNPNLNVSEPRSHRYR